MFTDFRHIFALGLLVLPLFILPDTQDPALFPRLVLLALILAAVSLAVLNSGRRQLLPIDTGFTGPIWWLVLAYPAIVLIASLGSHLFSESLMVLARVLMWTGLIIVLNLALRLRPDSLTLWLHTVVIVSIALPILALLQYYEITLTGLPSGSPPAATMANRNLLASALLLMLPMVALDLYRSSGPWRLLAAVAIGLQVGIVVLTNSRSGWLALAILLPIVVAGGWRVSRMRGLNIGVRLSYASAWKTILIVGVAAAVLFATPLLRRTDQQSVTDRMATAFQTDQGSVAERLLLWDRTIRMYMDNPLIGVGPGQWKLHINSYGTSGLRSAEGEVLFQRPHNDFLWILAETGPIGLVAFLALLAVFLAAGWRIFTDVPDPDLRLIGLLLGCVVLVFAIVSTFSFPYERIFHLVLLAIAMAGLWSVLPFDATPQLPGIGRLARVTLLVITLLAVATAVSGYSRVLSEWRIVEALQERSQSNWPQVTTLALDAETWLSKIDHSATPYAYYAGLGLYGYGRIPDAKEAFERAYRVNPYHLHVINSLATTLETMEQHREAAGYFEKALAISPTFQPALLNYAATLYNVGQYRKAHNLISMVDPEMSPKRYQEYKTRIEQQLADTTTTDTTTSQP